MEQRLKLPVGIDDFEKIRRNEFYYVDKTKLIEQLLQNWGEVSLFTRPRRCHLAYESIADLMP